MREEGLRITSDNRVHVFGTGVEGVVARSERVVVGFANVTIRTVEHVSIDADGAMPSLVGQSVILAARAEDAKGERLAGSLPWVWTSSNETVVAIAPTTTALGGRMRASAIAPGRARITVSGENVTTSIDVQVIR